MGWVIRPFECTKCPHKWEDLVPRAEENEQTCPKCKSPANWVISVTNFNGFSIRDKESQAKELRRRSREHTKKELKKDPSHLLKKNTIKLR